VHNRLVEVLIGLIPYIQQKAVLWMRSSGWKMQLKMAYHAKVEVVLIRAQKA
jgi:hypothetical protein